MTKLGNWGKMTDAGSNDSGNRNHVTQTNDNADRGRGVHVTTQVGNTSVHDHFDQNGNYQGNTFGNNG